MNWNISLLALFAFAPIVLTLTLIYVHGWMIKQTMPLVCAITSILALVIWRISFVQLAASCIEGLLLSLQVIFILFSVIFLAHTLRESRVMAIIREEFGHISSDRRIQAIFTAWFFGSGIDCLFGFGLTGGLCAAILGGLGFPPACALMIGVMGPMTANAFSAAGTPLFIGVAGGLEQPRFMEQLAAAGMDLPSYLQTVSTQAAIFHGIAGTFVPLMMVMMMTRFFGKNHSWTEGLTMAPFAIFCGLAFTIPYALATIFIGSQFSSLIGSLIGMAAAIIAIKTNFLIPKDKWHFPPKKQWRSDWLPGKKAKYPYTPEAIELMPFWKAWLPFGLLALLLVISRSHLLPLREWLRSSSIQLPQLFNSTVNISIHPFYSPAIILLLMTGFSIWLYKTSADRVRRAFGGWSVRITVIALSNIPWTIATACIYKNSCVNAAGVPGMPQAIAQWLAQIPYGEYWAPFVSPFVAATGDFFVSNNTFSNIILSSFQYEWGRSLFMPSSLFMALQVVGSSAGNLISLHYLAGSGAVVGMLGWSAPMGRKTILPMLAYLTIVGILGLLAAHFSSIISFFSF